MLKKNDYVLIRLKLTNYNCLYLFLNPLIIKLLIHLYNRKNNHLIPKLNSNKIQTKYINKINNILNEINTGSGY